MPQFVKFLVPNFKFGMRAPRRQLRARSISRLRDRARRLDAEALSFHTLAEIGVVQEAKSDIERARRAWRRYRRSHERDAIYPYLGTLYLLARKWRGSDFSTARPRCALHLHGGEPRIDQNPFNVLIYCSSDQRAVDNRLRSKWVRALRWVRYNRVPTKGLIGFMKEQGGINGCATQFARLHLRTHHRKINWRAEQRRDKASRRKGMRREWAQ